jgi:aspartate 1-decarboxylase
MRTILKSKIQGIKVTDSDYRFQGSIILDGELMDEANILEYEKVEVLNVSTGSRFETYAVRGDRGRVILNGAASRLVQVGDELMVLSYEIVDVGVFQDDSDKKAPKYVRTPKIINYGSIR